MRMTTSRFDRAMLPVFKSLSDRTRLRLIRLLMERDLCVCELTFILRMDQSRVSHQLRILRDAGLVEDFRDGQWVEYRILPEIRAGLSAIFRAFGKEAAAGDDTAADRDRLGLCLRRGVRKKRCPSPPPLPTPGHRRKNPAGPTGKKGASHGR
jgi:ArsR family transcriptional regulator